MDFNEVVHKNKKGRVLMILNKWRDDGRAANYEDLIALIEEVL